MDSISYHITVEDEEMKSCTCNDFVWNGIAYDMYLLKRQYRNILLFEGKKL